MNAIFKCASLHRLTLMISSASGSLPAFALAMVSLRRLLMLCSFLIPALSAPSAAEGQSKPVSGLNVAAQAAKKLYFGTATNADQWNDTTYYDILKDDAEFGQITPANVMKWVRTASTFPLLRCSLV